MTNNGFIVNGSEVKTPASRQPRKGLREKIAILIFVLAAIVAVLVIAGVSIGSAMAQEIVPGPMRVVDGDTIDILLRRDGVAVKERVRLRGFDAPETAQAQCPAESELGIKATLRLDTLIGAAKQRILRLYPDRDRYGRMLGNLILDGVDVGDVLIREGLARPYDGRSRRLPWCPSV